MKIPNVFPDTLHFAYTLFRFADGVLTADGADATKPDSADV